MSLIRALFFLLSATHLTAVYYQQELLIYLTKPALVTTLAVYFLMMTHAARGVSERYITYGLLTSVVGDTLLMFVESGAGNDLLFTLGLGSFLVTHLLYAAAFLHYQPLRTGFLRGHLWYILPFVLYLCVNTLFLSPDLPATLRLPVWVYSIVITAMALAAYNLKNTFPSQGFSYLLGGVLLFVLSDTLIGWHKFKTATLHIPQARLWIMATYLASQYLLVTTWATHYRLKPLRKIAT